MLQAIQRGISGGTMVLCAALALTHAEPIDFYRIVTGSSLIPGVNSIGSYQADIHFNTNPLNIDRHAVFGMEYDFPDHLAEYNPLPAFQDKFFIQMSYFLNRNAPEGFANRSFRESDLFLIDNFTVFRNFESSSNEVNRLAIHASRNVGGYISEISFLFQTVESSNGVGTSLYEILLGDMDLMYEPESSKFHGVPLGFPYSEYTWGVSSFGSPEVSPSDVAAVPEPGTLLLSSLGMASLVLMRRRRVNRTPGPRTLP